jgi:hypothetical protein
LPADELEGSLGFNQLTRRPTVRPQRIRRGLLAGVTVRLVAQLPQVVHQRLKRAGIVDAHQTASAGVNRGLLAGIVRRGATRLAEGRPSTLLPTSH